MSPVPFKRLSLVPVLVTNLYSGYGVLFRQWGVADLFFWFWCEFVFSGICTLVVAQCWLRGQQNLKPGFARLTTFTFLFGFGMVLLYATMFAAIAYRGEWQSYDRFREFLEGKWVGLFACALSFVGWLLGTITRSDFLAQDYNILTSSFTRRCWVVIGLYAVLMFSYHWSGSRTLTLTPKYLQYMAAILIACKLLAEAGVFDRLVKRRLRGGG